MMMLCLVLVLQVFFSDALKFADYAILSTESGLVSVVSRFIINSTHSSIIISILHQLRLTSHKEDELRKLLWQGNKDETTSSCVLMRFNLLQLV